MSLSLEDREVIEGKVKIIEAGGKLTRGIQHRISGRGVGADFTTMWMLHTIRALMKKMIELTGVIGMLMFMLSKSESRTATLKCQLEEEIEKLQNDKAL